MNLNKFKSAGTTCRNIAEFADAVALASVSGYSFHESLHHRGNWYKALLFASVLIGLQASILLVRHFNTAEVKTEVGGA